MPPTPRPLRIGVDTGGTFTDVAVLRGGTLSVHKLPSTPDDPARAVLDGIAAVRGRARAVDVVHGTTVGLNAILTGRVARTALVTNRGFEDLIEIGRQTRTQVYDLHADKPVLPVPRNLRFGVETRRDAGGALLRRATREELTRLRDRLSRARVDAIAIGLLHSYAHPEDERAIARALAPLGVPITCSAELLAVSGEYERYAAAVLNAAITPVVGSYLQRLAAGLDDGALRLMRSSGGIMSSAEATRFPARAVLSGPAGGVLATRHCARAFGHEVVAGFDMGGTSTDVSLIGTGPGASDGTVLGGLPLAVPAVEVHTIGCGGGSIAMVDPGGALRVGPDSAGAIPGPACYGHGDQPTVTDAHMVLGHMGAETLLGGAFPVDPDLSARAVERLGRRLGLTLAQTARGILEVAEVAMRRALMVITVERAIDPMGVPLVAFGGAGGLHAASLARQLGMPFALVPAHPGALSAVGLALAAESHEVVVSVLQPLSEIAGPSLRQRARAAAAGAVEALGPGPRPRAVVGVRLRYAGQGDGLTLALGGNLEDRFSKAHEQRFGFAARGTPIEVVELRARAERRERRLPAAAAPKGNPPASGTSRRRRPPAGGPAWQVVDRADLGVGSRLRGPCLIEERTGVTVVPTRVECLVRDAGLQLR